MSAPIPTVEPSVLVAGDTWHWTKSLNDYSAADGWALSYAFRLQQGSGLLDLVASTSGNDFSLTVPAASSSLMKAGTWLWASYVSLSGSRYSIETGTLTVKPNLSAITFDTDLRSDAKQALDNAMVAWKKVTLGQTVTLNNRTYTQHNLKDLILFVNQCKTDYQRELDAERFAQTGINPRRIGVRLVRI